MKDCPLCKCENCGAPDPPPADDECNSFKCGKCGHIYTPSTVDKNKGEKK